MSKKGVIRSAGRVTEVHISKGYLPSHLQENLRGGKKQALTEWSSKSRRNCLRTLMACDWSAVKGQPVMVTLTYADVQMDGRPCQGHLKAFRKAWVRQWGHAVGAWKKEFQARGAIHWHLVLYVPVEFRLRGEELEPVAIDVKGQAYTWEQGRDWVLETWQRLVGEDTTIVQWQWWSGDFAWYFANYSTKKNKEYQQVAPAGSSVWGRRWGLWGIKPVWEVSEVEVSRAYRLRRVVRGLQRSQRRKSRRYGSWVIHRSIEGRERLNSWSGKS